MRRALIALPFVVAAGVGAGAAWALAWLVDQIDRAEERGMADA